MKRKANGPKNDGVPCSVPAEVWDILQTIALNKKKGLGDLIVEILEAYCRKQLRAHVKQPSDKPWPIESWFDGTDEPKAESEVTGSPISFKRINSRSAYSEVMQGYISNFIQGKE
jgi:hypothetical protein